jgi:hypothetical protein
MLDLLAQSRLRPLIEETGNGRFSHGWASCTNFALNDYNALPSDVSKPWHPEGSRGAA